MEHRRFCLVGKGISHSLSPLLYQAVFEAAGFPWTYELRECEDMQAFSAVLADESYSLFNVTTPYKRDALATAAPSACVPCADAAQSAARHAGGANLVLRAPQGGLACFNVDGMGCAAFLRRAGVVLEGSFAVVCGTGPTARAIQAALGACGSRVCLLSRAAHASFRVPCYTYESPQAQDALARADVVVDATPLGMHPNDPAPIDAGALNGGAVVMDVVYGHGETALLRQARAAGCRSFDGLGMLLCQAVETMIIAQSAFAVPQPLNRREIFAIMESCVGSCLQEALPAYGSKKETAHGSR